MNATQAANQVDAHIGARIAMRRTVLGLTREALARALNLTEREVEAFEGGAARVHSATLFELAALFDVTVAYFFEADSLGPGRPALAEDAREFNQAG